MGSAWCLVSVSPLWMLSLLPVPPSSSFSSSVPPIADPGHPFSCALHTLQGTVIPPALASGHCPSLLPAATVTLRDAHRCSHPCHCLWCCLGSPPPPLGTFLPPSLPLPSPGPRRVSWVLLCPPFRLSPQVCSEAAAPGDRARPLAHGGSPSQDSALSLHGHPLPPPSLSTLWLCGTWRGRGGTAGLMAEQYLGLGGRCPGHHEVVGRMVMW